MFCAGAQQVVGTLGFVSLGSCVGGTDSQCIIVRMIVSGDLAQITSNFKSSEVSLMSCDRNLKTPSSHVGGRFAAALLSRLFGTNPRSNHKLAIRSKS